MKEKSKIPTKVAIFKTPSKQDATRLLYNIFDNDNAMRSVYMVKTEVGVALVVHHDGWFIG